MQDSRRFMKGGISKSLLEGLAERDPPFSKLMENKMVKQMAN